MFNAVSYIRQKNGFSLLFGSFFDKPLNLLLEIFDNWIRHHGSGPDGRGPNALLHADVLHAHVVNVLNDAELNLWTGSKGLSILYLIDAQSIFMKEFLDFDEQFLL